MGSLLGGVFHREFYRCDDRASADRVAGTALSLAIKLCHCRGLGFRALGRLALVLPFSRAAALVVRRRADGYFARPRVKRCRTGKHLNLSPVVPAHGPQFFFHTFPHGSLYLFFPFLASCLSANLPRFLPRKDRHDGLDSISRGGSWRFDRWGCLRLAGSPWNAVAPRPPTHSVPGGVSHAVGFRGCSQLVG